MKLKWNDAMLRLYAVTDRAWLHGQSLFAQVEAAIRGGTTMIQLREKELPFDDFLAEAREMKRLCARCDVPLIINDNVEIALLSGADGVHVGQEDMAAEQIRKTAGRELFVGVTAKTVEAARAAQRAGANYLGSGAIFGSTTKTSARSMCMEMLRAICASVQIPVVAIGGIQRGNISALKGSGIHGVAVVSGIFAAENIEAECRLLRALSEEISVR